MKHIRALLLRLRSVFGYATQSDAELDSELESHLHMLMDEHVRAGMRPDEARRQALLTLGGLESIKETYRDRRGIPILDTTLQDVRYAWRALRRGRSAAVLGITVMALAIGANTAVFSVVYAVLIDPLPYPQQDHIVRLSYRASAAGKGTERSKQVSVPDVRDWQEQNTSFAALSYYGTERTPVLAGQTAEYTIVASVTPEFFHVFSAEPVAGRFFTDGDARPAVSGTAIVSDRYAYQHFGDPIHALGRTLRVADRSLPIVGVWAAAHAFPVDADLWVPMDLGTQVPQRRGNNFLAVARLKPEVSLEQAQSEMTAISERLAALYPDTNRTIRVAVTPLQQDIVGAVAPMLYLLLGAVATVLLVACATMATLLLAQGTARAPEIAIRTALGASRTRIVRQLLVEALVQALTAGAFGIVIALWGTKTLVALAPPDLPRLETVSVNGPVLLFTTALCLIVTVLFGLPPALRAARGDVHDQLRSGAGRVTGGGGTRTREWLAIAEIALSVVLVVTCALLVKSLVALQHVPLGFRTSDVVLMQATDGSTRDVSRSRRFFKDLLTDVRQMPGVQAAGAMMGPPGRVSSDSGYWVDRMPEQSPLSSALPAVMNVITPGAFGALGIPIVEGRDVTDGDSGDAAKIAVVNQSLAAAAFHGGPAIGRVLVAGFDSLDPMTIVGVVADVHQYGPAREPQPEIYMPYQQHGYNGQTLHLVVRAAGDTTLLRAALARKAREQSPGASVRVSTMESVLAEHLATPAFRVWLLSLFAAIALSLAMAGVYGVMSYVVGLRTKEIGVRMALGASAPGVLWLMLGRGLLLVGIGLLAGVSAAVAASRLVRGMLFEVTPYDSATYGVVLLSLAVLSLLAVYVPARRAARIDPMLVLRQE